MVRSGKTYEFLGGEIYLYGETKGLQNGYMSDLFAEVPL